METLELTITPRLLRQTGINRSFQCDPKSRLPSVRQDQTHQWEGWVEKLLDWLTKKYAVPKPRVQLIPADTLPDYDPEFAKDPRFRQTRGVFDHEFEKPTIFVLIGSNPAETESRIMSILFHEYHHYLDWLNPSRRGVPKRIPKLPYQFEVRQS